MTYYILNGFGRNFQSIFSDTFDFYASISEDRLVFFDVDFSFSRLEVEFSWVDNL